MKFTIARNELIRRLQDARLAVSTKSTLEILQYLKVKVENLTLTLLATNLEIGMKVDAILDYPGEAGEVCFHAADFQSGVESARPGDTLIISWQEGAKVAMITMDAGEAQVPVMSKSEYPDLPAFTGAGGYPPFTIAWEDLLEAYTLNVSSLDKDDTRPVFTGMLHEFTDTAFGLTKLVAANAHQLSYTPVTTRYMGDGIPDPALVPGSTIKTMITLLGRYSGDEVSLIVIPDRSQMVYKTQRFSLVTRLIEGRFPDWKGQLLQVSDLPVCARIETEEVKQLLSCLKPYTAGDSRHRMLITVEQGTVSFSATKESGASLKKIARSSAGYGSTRIEVDLARFLGTVSQTKANGVQLSFFQSADNALSHQPMRVEAVQIMDPLIKTKKGAYSPSFSDHVDILMPLIR